MTSKIDCNTTFFYPHQTDENQNEERKTELFSAIEQKNIPEVTRLLSLGCDPNCRNTAGMTTLEEALTPFKTVINLSLLEHSYTLVQLLMSSGASYTQPIYNQYLNIFDYAFARNNYELLFVLRQYYTESIYVSPTSWQHFFTLCLFALFTPCLSM